MPKTETMISSDHLSAIEKLGTRVEGAFTAEQAMVEGKLGGWNVRKWPSFARDPETGLLIPKPGRVDIVRDNPYHDGQIDFMGEASEGYNIIQNEEHADLLNALVDESGANLELAGAVDDGRKVFLSMKLPGHINIGGVDPIENSLIAINSHDSSMAFTLIVAPCRYACNNILNVGGENMFRVRHTSGAQKNLRSTARQALDMTFTYLDGFQAQAEELIQKTMTQAKFEEIIEREFGPKEDAAPATITRTEGKIEKIFELFADAQTQEGIRDTAWAGFNALTEWADHFSPTRGEDREAARAEKALLNPTFKQNALELMLSA